MDQTAQYITFVVRLQRIPSDEMAGIVERVRTGEKVRFRGLEAIGDVIVQMLAGEDPF